MDGLLRCTRYAFGPNRLHYCGPDANRELFLYMKEGASDPGLEILLKAFKTMYPYLRLIAEANRIRDLFDDRVVEAYWIGNKLLENVEKKKFYESLLGDHAMRKRLGGKAFDRITEHLREGALPHHSFHVLDIWKRTGHTERPHTLESIDACRVSWGKVIAVAGPHIDVEIEPFRYEKEKLFLGAPATKRITRGLDAPQDIEALKSGDIITIHWDVPCEVISARQATALKKYTLRHLALANKLL